MAKTSDYSFRKKPVTEELYMLTGFRQWADAGSVSSGLPDYLVKHTRAKSIGELKPDGFYLFQVPGTHDLMRPVVKYDEGFPTELDTQRNEFFYTGDEHRGLVIFTGDEPHIDAERYVRSLLDAAAELGVQRIIGLGGVYGELPYDKERRISCTYSMRSMRAELDRLAVTFSDYQGGASIDSLIGRRAGEREMSYLGLYAFVPAYDFSLASSAANTVRIENDFTAWLGLMRRINYLFKMNIDLRELEAESRKLTDLVRTKMEELELQTPQLDVSNYLRKLSQSYQELIFNPLDDVWDEELRRLLDKLDDEPGEK